MPINGRADRESPTEMVDLGLILGLLKPFSLSSLPAFLWGLRRKRLEITLSQFRSFITSIISLGLSPKRNDVTVFSASVYGDCKSDDDLPVARPWINLGVLFALLPPTPPSRFCPQYLATEEMSLIWTAAILSRYHRMHQEVVWTWMKYWMQITSAIFTASS